MVIEVYKYLNVRYLNTESLKHAVTFGNAETIGNRKRKGEGHISESSHKKMTFSDPAEAILLPARKPTQNDQNIHSQESTKLCEKKESGGIEMNFGECHEISLEENSDFGENPDIKIETVECLETTESEQNSSNPMTIEEIVTEEYFPNIPIGNSIATFITGAFLTFRCPAK